MNDVLQTYSKSSVNLTDSQISIIVNLVIFLVVLAGSIALLISLKNSSKGYKLLFIFYLVFWIPIFLGRDYRTKMNDAILDNLQIDKDGNYAQMLITIVMAGYGFVGIFARIFADYFSYLFKYRKAFLYFAIITNIITFIPIIAVQNQYTSIIQVIGVGISASCIGTVELLFRSQYDTKKSFLTVSILSIPPLLANFITAPIQSIVATYAKVGPVYNTQRLSLLWVIGLIGLVAALIMLFFIKENKLNVVKPLIDNMNRNIYVMHTVKQKRNKQNNVGKQMLMYFLILSFLGSVMAFIKFSNSGAIGISHLQALAAFNQTKSTAYEGYLSVVFSLAQLVAGILMGMVLIRKWKPLYIMLLGSGSWVLYLICATCITQPIPYFVVHALNGFGYGILYNLLLGLVLVISLNTVKVSSMGIYQSILSIGIATSGTFTSFMKKSVFHFDKDHNQMIANKDLYFRNNTIVNVVLILAIIGLCLIYFGIFIYSKKHQPEFHNKYFTARKQEVIINKNK